MYKDKALRRISELKEQCQLEEKAKRHLEEELRSDMEEKEHVIQVCVSFSRHSNSFPTWTVLPPDPPDKGCSSEEGPHPFWGGREHAYVGGHLGR